MLENPLAAVQMGLIYVNPEGPNGNPDPLQAAQDIRETFGRMAMNDEETVALIAGGHTFGKLMARASRPIASGRSPAAAAHRRAGPRLDEQVRQRQRRRHHHQRPGRRMDGNPGAWSTNYLQNLFAFDWVQTKSPAGATQWIPDDRSRSQPGAGRARSDQTPCADHADDRSVAEVRPELPEDRAALP